MGGSNWPGGSFDPANNHLYIHSHAQVYVNGLVPPNPGQSDMSYVGGQARGGGAGAGAAARGAGPGGRGAAGGGGRGGTVQGLPLIKPPYDRITAYNMNTGEIVWQKTHSSTPDDIRNHPALKGLDPAAARPTRAHVHRHADDEEPGDCGRGRRAHQRRRPPRGAAARLRQAHGRGRRRRGDAEKQTGSPMSYQIDGKQFIVLAVSGNDGAELLAYALP